MEEAGAAMLHDINNNLTVVKLSLEVSLQKSEIREVKNLANSALAKTLETIQLCQSYKKDLFLMIELGQFFRDFIRDEQKHYGIKLSFKSQGHVVRKVNIHRLKAVVINIVKNAVEAKAKKLEIELDKNIMEFIDDGVEGKIESTAVDTTKTSGSGMGLKSISEFCVSNNCTLLTKKRPGKRSGAMISIIFNKPV